LNLKAIFYDWGGLNTWLFHHVNNLQAAWWEQLMLLGTTLADPDKFPYYLAGLSLIVMVSLWSAPKFKWPYLLAVPMVFGVGYYFDKLTIGLLKDWFNYPRPLLALAPSTVHVLSDPKYLHSFPSGHTAFAALLAASVWPVLGFKSRIAVTLFIIWAGTSRLVLGVHFPADVLGGALVSIIICSLLWCLFIVGKTNVKLIALNKDGHALETRKNSFNHYR
jgi:membrane-associated phospholipid phosphatase